MEQQQEKKFVYCITEIIKGKPVVWRCFTDPDVADRQRDQFYPDARVQGVSLDQEVKL